VHSEIEKLVITLLVMRSFSVLLGAPRACLDFREPTAVFRFNTGADGTVSEKMQRFCGCPVVRWQLNTVMQNSLCLS